MPVSASLPIPDLALESVAVAEQRIAILAVSTERVARCPVCRSVSTRIHSHYLRTVADLPWSGRAISFALRVKTQAQQEQCKAA